MNKAVMIAAAIFAVLLAPLLVRPPVPEEWKALRAGDSIEVARRKVPELRRYDETMFTAHRSAEYLGIGFEWGMYVHFDLHGNLVDLNGRSRNRWSGLLDAHF